MKEKGQASTEFVITVFIVLSVAVLIFIILQQEEFFFYKADDFWKKEITCFKESSVLSSVYAFGLGADINYYFDRNAILLNEGSLFVGDINYSADEIEEGTVEDAFEPGTIAYYNCHNNELKLLPFMQDYNVDLYVNYGQDCGLGNDDELDDLVANLYKYNLIYLEDPNLHDQYKQDFDDWVADGNTLIVSEHILKSKGNFLGRYYNKKASPRDINAIIVGTHPFFPDLQPGGVITYIRFDDKPFMEGDLNLIAVYDTGEAAMSYWSYGQGQVIHIADINSSVYDEDGQLLPDYNFAGVVAAPASPIEVQIVLGDESFYCKHFAVVEKFKYLEGLYQEIENFDWAVRPVD